MVEQEKLLEIGKYTIDVSNVSVKRKRIAIRKWNELFNIKVDSDGEAILDEKGKPVERIKGRRISQKQADRGVLRIGIYLLKQDFNVLNVRYTRKESIKQIFLRRKITIKYLESLPTSVLNVFVEWIYETVVGVKKKVQNLIDPIIEELNQLVEVLTEKEMSDLIKFCTTSFIEQVGVYRKSINAQKKK